MRNEKSTNENEKEKVRSYKKRPWRYWMLQLHPSGRVSFVTRSDTLDAKNRFGKSYGIMRNARVIWQRLPDIESDCFIVDCGPTGEIDSDLKKYLDNLFEGVSR